MKHQFSLMKKDFLYFIIKITVMAAAEMHGTYNCGTRVPRHVSLLAQNLTETDRPQRAEPQWTEWMQSVQNLT